MKKRKAMIKMMSAANMKGTVLSLFNDEGWPRSSAIPNRMGGIKKNTINEPIAVKAQAIGSAFTSWAVI